jgi:cardiolipin synthase
MKDLLLIPNILTLSRILLIFPSIYYLDNETYYASFAFLVFLFLTDYFDGFFARKLHMTSYLGSILDPIADKIVVISIFTYLYYVEKVLLFYYILILIRDISQLLSIPILLLWKKIQFKVKPKLIPKWGTALNFLILVLICITYIFPVLNSDTNYIYLTYSIYAISSLIEIFIVSTYIPRFVQIYLGTHDTFE